MGALIAQLLSTIAAAAIRENIGDDSIAEILSIASALINRGVSASTELEALQAQVQMFVDQDREPTEDEWAQLRSRSDAAHATIQSTPVDNAG
ncbi:MAG: hypothetical protein ACR2PR_06010 [Pseudohongiellaceae bacterium]